MHKKSRSLVVGGLMGALALSGVVCSNFGVVHATMTCTTTDGKTTCSDTASATASVTVAAACNLTVSEDTPHTITLGNGAVSPAGGIGQTTLNAICNDPGGFAIYAVGFSNDEYGNNNMVANNGASLISTGTATSGATSNWAMKLTAVSSTSAGTSTTPTITAGYDSFHAVPSENTVVASLDGVTDVVGAAQKVGSSVTATYQAFVSSTQAAGDYVGQVKYTLVHPSSAAASDITIADMTYMQNFASLSSNVLASVKNSMTPDTQYQLKDSRDGKQYYVAKLSDDNVWMTQNLDLDINSVNITLNSNNTDISSDESVYTSAGTIYALGQSEPNYGYIYENGVATWIPQNHTIAYDALNLEPYPWKDSNIYPYSYDYLDASGNPVYPDSVVTQSAAGAHGLSGNYYNWPAAMASSDSTSASSYSGTKNSICPKGWRLPTKAEFETLIQSYGNVLMNSPLYFVRAGKVSAGVLDGISNPSYGLYWTSTTGGGSAYYLNFGESSADLSNGGNNANALSVGRSVRCVAK